MRKPLIIYLLLLPLLVGSPMRSAAAVIDIGARSPWSDSAAASENLIDDNGVKVDNLFTGAPRFDSVPSNIAGKLGLAHCRVKDPSHSIQPPMFLLNRSFLI